MKNTSKLIMAALALVMGVVQGRADAPAVLTYKDVDKQPQIESAEFAGFYKPVADGKEVKLVVAIVVTEKGRIEGVPEILGTDDAGFAQATVAMLPKWKFWAAKKGGKKVKCATVIRIFARPTKDPRRDGNPKVMACEYRASLVNTDTLAIKGMWYYEKGPPEEALMGVAQ